MFTGPLKVQKFLPCLYYCQTPIARPKAYYSGTLSGEDEQLLDEIDLPDLQLSGNGFT